MEEKITKDRILAILEASAETVRNHPEDVNITPTASQLEEGIIVMCIRKGDERIDNLVELVKKNHQDMIWISS